jgi:uncharacterized Tic20 family protein
VYYCWFDACIYFFFPCLFKWCVGLVRLSDHTSRSLLLFNKTDDTSFFFSLYRSFALSLLDSCDERVMRTDVDDNKSGDQQNGDDDNDEIIKDMKYDFFCVFFFFFPTFFLLFSSLFSYLLFWQFMNSEEALSITSRNGDSFNSSHTLTIVFSFFLLTKPIVYVYMIGFFFFFSLFVVFSSFINQRIHEC